MKAMVLEAAGRPLALRDLPVPDAGPGEIVVRVEACAVCRTDLHVYEGDLRDPKLPLILGHEIVGTVVDPGASGVEKGSRVGIPWLGRTCGRCRYCADGRENLCDLAEFTGYTLDGGFAEYAKADARYCFPIPDAYSNVQAAPLLCAGLIGFRALRMAGDPRRIGLYGFGAAAHIVIQIARHEGRDIFAFTRPGDDAKQAFAKSLGASWSGGSDATAPEPLDAAILFAPVGALVPQALRAVRKGGVVVCAGIHMDPIPSFPYEILWGERVIRSVANLTRQDAIDFFAIAPRVPVRAVVETVRLEDAGVALQRLESGDVNGALVIVPDAAFHEKARA